MRKENKRMWNKRKLCAVSVGLIFMPLLLIGFILYIKHATGQAETVSIIGGADGPTAILVAGTSGGGWVLPAVVGIVVAALVVVLIRNKNK